MLTMPTPKASAIAGIAGRYASMLNGPSATSAPKKSINIGGGRSSVPASVINSSMRAVCSAPPNLQKIAVQRAGNERVIDRAVRKQGRQLANRHEHDFRMLRRSVRDLGHAHDSQRVKAVETIAEQRRVRINGAERNDVRRTIAR